MIRPNVTWNWQEQRYEPNAGFQWRWPGKRGRFEVVPILPNVTWNWREQRYDLDEGYQWSDLSDPNHPRYIPKPYGMPHERYPNVIWNGQGQCVPAPGYMWKDASRFTVCGIPGTPHAAHPNLVWAANGELDPAEGYAWIDPDDDDNLDVRPVPDGTPDASHPNVVWNGAANRRPADGFQWVDGEWNDQLRVERIPGSNHVRFPNVVYGPRDQFLPREGYRWLSPGTIDRRVVPNAGTRMEGHEGLIWNEQGRLTPAQGYRWATNAPGDLRVVPAGTGDSVVRVVPPSTVPYEPHYVRVPVERWPDNLQPIVRMGGDLLREIQGQAREAADSLADRLLGIPYEMAVSRIPGYQHYTNIRERYETLQERLGDGNRRTLQFALTAMERSADANANPYDDGGFAESYDQQLERHIREREDETRYLIGLEIGDALQGNGWYQPEDADSAFDQSRVIPIEKEVQHPDQLIADRWLRTR